LLSSEKPTDESLNLHWTPYKGWGDGNVAEYVIYRKADPKANYRYDKIKKVPGGQLSTNIEETNKGVEQCFRIKALKNGGNEVQSWSNEVCRNFPPFLFVPNAFSPWDDNGINDQFRVETANMLSFEMTIYTRWGEKVFETTDSEEGWDGTYQGKQAPVGVYLLKIRYQGYELTKTYTGVIHLIR